MQTSSSYKILVICTIVTCQWSLKCGDGVAVRGSRMEWGCFPFLPNNALSPSFNNHYKCEVPKDSIISHCKSVFYMNLNKIHSCWYDRSQIFFIEACLQLEMYLIHGRKIYTKILVNCLSYLGVLKNTFLLWLLFKSWDTFYETKQHQHCT